MKTVIAILAGIALAAITGGEDDVDHFAGGDKVQDVLRARCMAKEVSQKFLHGSAQHGGVLRGIHAVAVQFDKKPVGTTGDGNCGALPQGDAANVGRSGIGEAAIFNPSFSSSDGCEMRQQRTLDN